MSLFDKLKPISDRLAIFGGHLVPLDTVIDGIAGPTEVVIDGRPTLMCGSNNYLGLSFHPKVIAAAQAALEREGTGTTGSRVANGTFAAHRRLEQRFAEVYGLSQAMIFSTGYQANLGIISGLCGADDTILVDIESHASIYDGAKLSGATLFQFRHNSAADLRRKLSRQPQPTRCLVVVEGLYSISGDVAPLADIASVCREYGASLMVDEAHSFGVFGQHGLGCAEDQGVLDSVDFITGTFSKTLAGIGGFCVSPHAELKYLHFASRPYVFTASSSPANIAGVEMALTLQQAQPELRDRLWDNVRHVRSELLAAGFTIGPTESPIVPIIVGTEEQAVTMWQAMLTHGVYTNLVLPPACHPDACVLRTSYSAAHTTEQLDRALATFREVGRALRIIDAAA
ncbi:MAG: pyridoxal phosphate-dependent aminotransferase family protein [Acidobacteriaceae bacterium]|jgi:8-amino-7-oxononanoate synthase|nr:pyridoxal phosphate-dependent aminotransferase family protein [Acidobacteriaceae bacterium]